MQLSEPGRNVLWHPFAVLVGCAVAGLAVFAVVAAPAQRAAFAKFRADDIAAEDRDICRKFRMPEGSADFAMCSALLKDVRKREAHRAAQDAAGIL